MIINAEIAAEQAARSFASENNTKGDFEIWENGVTDSDLSEDEIEKIESVYLDAFEKELKRQKNGLQKMTQITEHDERGYTWLVDACEYIDNQERLEGALKEIGADYRVDESGNLFAYINNVIEADAHAHKADNN